MKIAIIGTGYVGLVSGACFADFGHDVTCVDSNPDRVADLERGHVPFFEPGLAELVTRQAAAGRLRFTTRLGDAMPDADVAFLAVGTPESASGEADVTQVLAVAEQLGRYLNRYRVIVTKSTVPVGTGALLTRLFRDTMPDAQFDVVSNPEFLREGSAISDFLRPDRVVIGSNSERAAAIMREIYRPLFLIETPLVFTTVETAEMVKYASNAFLAVKISFMNEVANLCDRVGADVHIVAKGMGLDKRIGSKFLHPGPGYGGSCFPKDTRALAALGERHGARQSIVQAAIGANRRQIDVAFDKVTHAIGDVKGATIALLGLAFKPNTSDVREAPALHLCRLLSQAGASVRAYDPVAQQEAAHALGTLPGLSFARDAYDASAGADAVVIVTEWNEFRSLDLSRLSAVVKRAVLVDLRNVLDPAQVRQKGFDYHCTGRGRVEMRSPVLAAPAR